MEETTRSLSTLSKFWLKTWSFTGLIAVPW